MTPQAHQEHEAEVIAEIERRHATWNERANADWTNALFITEGSAAHRDRWTLFRLLKSSTDTNRERVVQWMMNNGYATGHGDDIEMLLGELTRQHDERVKSRQPPVLTEEVVFGAVRKVIYENYMNTVGMEAAPMIAQDVTDAIMAITSSTRGG